MSSHMLRPMLLGKTLSLALLALALAACGSAKHPAGPANIETGTTASSATEATSSPAAQGDSDAALCRWVKAHGNDTGPTVITEERRRAEQLGDALGKDVAALAGASQRDLSAALAAYGTVIADCRAAGVSLPAPG